MMSLWQALRLRRGSSEQSGLHIYYDIEGNIPYFKYSYARERAKGKLVDACSFSRWWCDPRPLTRHDRAVVERALLETRVEDSKIFIKLLDNLVMVNTDNDAILDQVWEFIVNGVKAFTMYYDYLNDKYVIVPGVLAALLLYMEGAVGEARRANNLYASRVRGPGPYYIVVEHGVPVGIAVEVKELSSLVIVEEWDKELLEVAEKALDARRVTNLDVYRANLEYIEGLVEKTRRVVEWLEGRLGRRGVLGFSGGKDSLLALNLLVEAGSNVVAFYSHIEHGDPPHIPKFVERVTSMLGVELVVNINEWSKVERMLKAFRMPTRGYRWCTQVFKIAPLMSYLRRLGRERVVSYTGSRSFETFKRGLKPATYVDVEHGILVHAVPYKWPRFLEMLALHYRFKTGLPWDYEAGFERVSCVTCPNKSVCELRLAERLFPEDYSVWIPYMLEASKQVSPKNPEKALKLHIWRLPLQPGDLRVLAYMTGLDLVPRLPGPRQPPKRASRRDLERCVSNVKILMGGEARDGSFLLDGCIARVDERYGVWLERGLFSRCARLLKAVYASLYCVECGACVNKCPYDAIRLPFQVDPERCKPRECLVCIDTCPLAWGAIDMALANIVLGYRRAFERLRLERERKGRVYVEKAREAEERIYRTKGGGGGGEEA